MYTLMSKILNTNNKYNYQEEYEINTERPAIRDRICMILQNPRKLDKLAVAVFSISFALYNFNYWVIMDHNA